MAIPDTSDRFLEKLNHEVQANLTNDQFGVEELSRNMGMSRSQLHRKLTSLIGKSVTQFIREYRLERSLELLKKGDLTAAEIASRVGFGSPTYFSKCFNDHYGFPPGEAKNRVALMENMNVAAPMTTSSSNKLYWLIAVAMVLTGAFWVYFTFKTTEVPVADKSIAILPFKNLSTDPHDEYFSEGVVEAIRTGLSQIEELRVISRTSVEQYRESPKTARAIGQELQVSTLLEGTIQRNNDRVRVDVRLVNAATEALVWGGSFDRELKDVFAIQNEIASNVAGELNAKLSEAEKSRLTRSDTRDPKAYDLYLKAKYEYRTYTNRGAHNSIELLTEAIRLDPDYARAYAFLANSYIGLATIWGAELSAIQAMQKGKPFIDKALSLDPGLDEAHMLLGFYKLYHDWDFVGAEEEYKKGIINDHPDAIAVYTDYLNFMSRHKEAMRYADLLNQEHPYYPNSRIVLTYFYNDRLKEAMEFSESRLQMFHNYSTYDLHGFLLLNTNRFEEAITFFEKAIALEGIRYPRMLGWMGAAYAKAGKTAEAKSIIEELQSRLENNDHASISFFIAVVYSALNDKKAALKWIDAAYAAHDMEMPWLMTEPQFYNLHSEPEFIGIARNMGF